MIEDRELTPRQMWALLQSGDVCRLTINGTQYPEPVRYTAEKRQGQIIFTLKGLPCGVFPPCGDVRLCLTFHFDTLEGDACIVAHGVLARPRCPGPADACMLASRLEGRVRLRPADCCPCRRPEPCPCEPDCVTLPVRPERPAPCMPPCERLHGCHERHEACEYDDRTLPEPGAEDGRSWWFE